MYLGSPAVSSGFGVVPPCAIEAQSSGSVPSTKASVAGSVPRDMKVRADAAPCSAIIPCMQDSGEGQGSCVVSWGLPTALGHVPVTAVRVGKMQSVGPSESHGMERGRPGGQVKKTTPISYSQDYLESHMRSRNQDWSRRELSGPEEGLTELPERFWTFQNHVGIFVATLQGCQCGYC